MWYILLFFYLCFLIIYTYISENFILKTKDTIKYHPSFGRTFYRCSLFCWGVGGLLPCILSNQKAWEFILISLSISFVMFLFSFILIFSYSQVENNSIVRRFCFFKKIIKYEDFLLYSKPGGVVGTSAKTGRELFFFSKCYINVDFFLQDYSKFIKTNEIKLESSLVRANKNVAYFGLFFLLFGFVLLALAIISIIPNLFEEMFPLYFSILFWILSLIVLGFSLCFWILYFFNYLVINNNKIIVHRPFRHKKEYDSQNIYIEQNLYFLKLKDGSNKLVFITPVHLTQNLILLYECLNKKI